VRTFDELAPLCTRSAASAALEASSASGAVAVARPAAPQVVLTREKGKNGKLQKVLEARGITSLEVPLIETAPGPDRYQRWWASADGLKGLGLHEGGRRRLRWQGCWKASDRVGH
jgi:hypothetical protein